MSTNDIEVKRMLCHDPFASPYYIIKDIDKKDKSEVNHSHEDAIGKRCTILSLHVGRSAQLLVDVDYDDRPHRFWTSEVIRVRMEENEVLVETRNSNYLLVREAAR